MKYLQYFMSDLISWSPLFKVGQENLSKTRSNLSYIYIQFCKLLSVHHVLHLLVFLIYMYLSYCPCYLCIHFCYGRLVYFTPEPCFHNSNLQILFMNKCYQSSKKWREYQRLWIRAQKKCRLVVQSK